MVVVKFDALEMADTVVVTNLKHAVRIVKAAFGEGCGGCDKAADQRDGQSLFHGVLLACLCLKNCRFCPVGYQLEPRLTGQGFQHRDRLIHDSFIWLLSP